MNNSFCKQSCVLFLLVVATDTFPLITSSFLMVHPESSKSVVLLDDAHSGYLKMAMTDAQQHEKHAGLYDKQKEFITRLACAMLAFDAQKGAQTVVITESPVGGLIALAEQEVGAVQMQDSGEIIEVLSRIFLRELLPKEGDIDAKFEIFMTAQKPFGKINAISFELSNEVRWIAGDRLRDDADFMLAFQVYIYWEKIRDEIKLGRELPEILRDFTIGCVKGYIDTLHIGFEHYGLVDPFYQKISYVIAEALATKKLSESDHLAFLHEFLLKGDGNSKIRDEFNNNLISFLSQKFDVELFGYLSAFEKDEKLKYAFVFAGAEHNKQLRTLLLSKGYRVEEKAGIELSDAFLGVCLEDKNKLTELFEAIKEHSPFIGLRAMVA